MEDSKAAIATPEWEEEQLKDIEDSLNALQHLQNILLVSKEPTVPSGDLKQASGRRCVLGVVGLQHHKYEKFFEVSERGVLIVEPYDNFNTYIAAPVDAVLRVLKGVLNGDISAFSAEWARGTTKIIGERRLHDGWIFSEVFRSLAAVIKRYRES